MEFLHTDANYDLQKKVVTTAIDRKTNKFHGSESSLRN
jgi:hypothetical protein